MGFAHFGRKKEKNTLRRSRDHWVCNISETVRNAEDCKICDIFISELTTLLLSSAALVNKLLLLYRNMQRLRDFLVIYLSFQHFFMSPFFFEPTANNRQPFLSVGDALKRDLLGWTLVNSRMGATRRVGWPLYSPVTIAGRQRAAEGCEYF